MSYATSACEEDLVFNYLGLAYAKDNEDSDEPTYEEGEEVQLALELLQEIVGLSKDQLRQIFFNRL